MKNKSDIGSDTVFELLRLIFNNQQFLTLVKFLFFKSQLMKSVFFLFILLLENGMFHN